MQKATKLIVALVVVIIIVGGVVFVMGAKKANSPSNNNNGSNIDASSSSKTTITYDGTSFEPNSITVKKGEHIRIVNQSSDTQLDFGSDPHPVHTDDPDLNAGDIDPGASKTITVVKTGTFGYHNHFNPSQHGKITIVE